MKLLVMDGNSIVNRAYYGIRPLTNREGLYTHAIYGFIMTMQRLLEEEDPQALCITFDLKAPTFRHLEYEGYKAQRKGMPQELAQQMPVLKQVLEAMNIPYYQLEGYEADDLIGSISRRCEAAGWDCVIATGDKDSLQLITPHTKVKLVSTRMGQTQTKDMTEEAFRQEYGFDPIHMVDLKALMGDSSDNIPGVPGVGDKTAMALVQRYGSIEALYAAMPEVEAKPAVLRKLQEGEESARLSHHLATIITDVPMDFAPEKNLRCAPGPELYGLFARLEFAKLIEKYGLHPAEDAAAAVETKTCEMTCCPLETEAQAEQYLAEMARCEAVAVYALPDLGGLSLCWETEEGLRQANVLFFRYAGDFNALLRKLFSADIPKVSHDVKDLMRLLLDNGLPAEGFVFDTALAAYLLDATAGSFTLSRLAMTYLQQELPQPLFLQEDAFSALGGGVEAEQALGAYAAAVYRLMLQLKPSLKELSMEKLFYEVELPLCRVLAEMERSGVLLDARALAAYGELLQEKALAAEQQIYDLAGESFNINSPKQLGQILFEKLQLPHGKKTKTGYSTNADVLEKLRYEYPIVELVLQYRQLTKLKSTYADGLLKVIEPDGRIRSSFQMTVTATGRLSSVEPNLQNIPTRTELGSELRRMFVAEEGNVLVDADYSQIELRLLAHMAGDEAMSRAFRENIDVHSLTASQVFAVPVEEVTSQMRRSAKAVNFGIVYGISAFSLAQDIGVSVAEAKQYMDAYFNTYAGVREYMDRIVAEAGEQGYVETLLHRRRALPELSSSNFNMRAFGQRVALNMPIQGTAADIMKLAMIRVFDRMQQEGLSARMVLQVHDELIVECPAAEEERVRRLLTEEMEQVMSLSVPLVAEAHSGKNWLEAK